MPAAAPPAPSPARWLAGGRSRRSAGRAPGAINRLCAGQDQIMATPRLMVILFVATGVIVAAVAALALNSWVLLVVVLGLHAVVSTLVVGVAWRRAGDT